MTPFFTRHRDRETINGALMQIFVHLDLWIFQDRDKNGYKEKVMNNSTKKYLLRIFLFFQLNLNWKWCLTKGGGSEDIKHSRIKFTTKMKFRWSILCWKKHHKSKRAKPPKVVRMPTMSTHQHECIVQSYEHLVFSALSWRTKWVFVCVKFPETHWDTLLVS